ncbi:hypothetical protein AVEN_119847-1 [Araneus ventricosus]|uniref:Uncharacterized protein n=1 Tax=Araneus ventricosus TaxID=182803 RepID=A0A4Y2GLR2_ARAVE|nr:hypothetical protein AVEN_119847-1 [Araneus ventricosus]
MQDGKTYCPSLCVGLVYSLVTITSSFEAIREQFCEGSRNFEPCLDDEDAILADTNFVLLSHHSCGRTFDPLRMIYRRTRPHTRMFGGIGLRT